MKTYRSQSVSPLQLLILGSVLALGGCTWFSDPVKSTGTADAPANKTNPAGGVPNAGGPVFYVVKADFTPLYRTGPQQPNGPDQSLPKDTVVTLLKRSFGFSRVQLANGLDGYVANEDLAPARADQVAPAAPVDALNTGSNSAITEHYSVEKAAQAAATSTSNAEALPELPEPQPTPIEKPDFRY